MPVVADQPGGRIIAVQTSIERSDPEFAVPIGEQPPVCDACHAGTVTQPRFESGGGQAIVSIQPFVRGEPEESDAVLRDVERAIVGQASCERDMLKVQLWSLRVNCGGDKKKQKGDADRRRGSRRRATARGSAVMRCCCRRHDDHAVCS